jgi:hypothetical protein
MALPPGAQHLPCAKLQMAAYVDGGGAVEWLLIVPTDVAHLLFPAVVTVAVVVPPHHGTVYRVEQPPSPLC